MSFKSKNLTYEQKEPAFLRRLKGQYTSQDTDRHEQPIARPRKQKIEDPDDEPTYVDADSLDVLSKEDYATLLGKGAQASEQKPAQEAAEEQIKGQDSSPDEQQAKGTPSVIDDIPRPKQSVADVGQRSKRKAIRVIGEEHEDDPPDSVKTASSTQPKKKKKKIQLSFQDEDENK